MEESEAINSLKALIPFLLITFIIAIGVLLLNLRFRKTLFRQQLQQERERLEHQQSILETAIEVQEEERERFAKDLHDEMGAMLSICKRWLIQLEEEKPDNGHKIAEIRELVGVVLDSTRRISHDLMPLQLENTGLEQALLSLARNAEKTGNINVEVRISAQLENLNHLMNISLYRIYSELINNSLKYADADQLCIEITAEEDCLICSYSDNGVGLEEKETAEGLGLRSIKNRVQAMNGVLELGSDTTQGFFAHISLPLIVN